MSTEANKKYSFELLADYVDGLVDQQTAENIEKAIAEDEETREIVEGIRFFYEEKSADRASLENYLDDFGDRLAKGVAENPKYAAEASAAAKSKQSISPLRIAAAIALLIAAGFLFFEFSGGQDNPVLAQLEETYPGPITTRSGDSQSSGDAELKEKHQSAAAAYNKGDYETAGDLFFELSAVRQDSDEWIFYTALSRLYDDKFEESVASFDQLRSLYHQEGAPGIYNQQAEWYMSLALYLAGDEAKAITTWEKIAGQTSHYKRAAAAEILEFMQ